MHRRLHRPLDFHTLGFHEFVIPTEAELRWFASIASRRFVRAKGWILTFAGMTKDTIGWPHASDGLDRRVPLPRAVTVCGRTT